MKLFKDYLKRKTKDYCTCPEGKMQTKGGLIEDEMLCHHCKKICFPHAVADMLNDLAEEVKQLRQEQTLFFNGLEELRKHGVELLCGDCHAEESGTEKHTGTLRTN